MIPLKDFVKVVEGEFISGDPHSLIGKVSTDTRKISEGDCFFALVGSGGQERDGHNFIKDAVTRNASAIVFSRDDILLGGDEKILLKFPALIKVKDTLRALGDYARFVRSGFEGKVVCVAGSNGKTTVKNMIHSILSLVGKTLKSPGNYNNLIGLPLTILSLEGDESFLVLEAGISIKGEMSRLSEIAMPDVAVLTNIGREHLEGLSDIKTVFDEEIKIFDNLRADGVAVVNLDGVPDVVKVSGRIQRLAPSVRVIGFSTKEDFSSGNFHAVVKASNINHSADGISFNLIGGSGASAEIFLKINGMFNVSNALAAAAVGVALNIPLEKIKKGLESFQAVEGRMQKMTLANGCIIINDAYNANPDSMRASISAFVESYPRRSKILILGDMLELGIHSLPEHIALGEFVMTLPFEEVLLVGENMRQAYLRMKEIDEEAKVKHFNSKNELIDEILGAKKYFLPDNALFFKGSHSMGLEEIAMKIYNIRSLEV